ncbi:hypothetical protein [Nonomuraea maheshkhaliensis]|uniref:hypothetical protein n=1 Tax=Nonomuraea maheshkhaliensis TaxID=419590 RepID=UPI0031F9E405
MLSPPTTAREFLARHLNKIRALNRPKIPSAEFKVPGTKVIGVLVEKPRVIQQTEYITRRPLFFSDGTPRMQLRVVLDTGQCDPNIPNDNGWRVLYLKAASADAVALAMEAVGVEEMDIGGVLSVTFTQWGQANGNGHIGREWESEYLPPDPILQQQPQQATAISAPAPHMPAAGSIASMTSPVQAPAQGQTPGPVLAQAPAQATPPVPAPTGAPAEVTDQLAAAGLDAATLARLAQLSPAALARLNAPSDG